MDYIFYHWSPRNRRAQITKLGLVPGKWSPDRLWKPPFICLATTALDAWHLSGKMDRILPPSVVAWDLWEVDVRDQSGYEELYYGDTERLKEIRVYERIYKRNVWFVGERKQ